TADSEPIEGLPVHAIVLRIAEGKKRIEPARTVNTDKDGNFRIAGRYPGSYYVEAAPTQRFMKDAGFSGRYLGSSGRFYPYTHDLSSATIFALTPGQTVYADFSLKEESMFHIAGSISCLDPNDFINLRFLDRLGQNRTVPIRFGPKPCEFHGEVFTGALTLVANTWHEGRRFSVESTLNVTTDITGISLVPRPMQSIPITVRTESIRPPITQGAAAKIPNTSLASLHLIAKSGLLSQSGYHSELQGDRKNSSLVLRNVPIGRYSVEVDATGSWYVQSAQCGDT